MKPPKTQPKQRAWHDQWSHWKDDQRFLFLDWIHPVTLEDLRGKSILEAGCGGGQHTSFMAPFAKHVTGVDLNTASIARERNRPYENVRFLDADIATLELEQQFDVVMSIGVIHHTNDPEASVRNLVRHLKPGGRLILWVYSKEGNKLAEYVVEPLRQLIFRHLPPTLLRAVSKWITLAMAIPIHTLYRLPLKFLPYYEYFENFRRLSLDRNTLNVFDKLNAPQVQFISRERAERWFSFANFKTQTITPYRNVSWRVQGTLVSQAI